MADQGGNFVQDLQNSGFFDQVKSLQGSLSHLSEDIASIGDQATQRLAEMDSITAHVMAIEAVLAVMLKQHPVDADEVKAVVKARTADMSGQPNGSPAVQAVAQDILGNSEI